MLVIHLPNNAPCVRTLVAVKIHRALNKIAISNCCIYTGDSITKNASILIEDGKIISVLESIPAGVKTIDLEGWNIAPGLIDIQLNGGEELYFSDNLSIEALDNLYYSSLKHGATHVLPCLISSPREKILEAIELVKHYGLKHPHVLGLHLEGPFIHPDKKGAHSADIIRKPTNEELEEIIFHGRDVIQLMTIAPEVFTDQQLDMLLSSGIRLSIGHSTIGYEQAKHYFGKGIHMVTHLFNAMTQFLHREPGLVGAALETKEVFTPVILDGAHCHYAAARIAFAIKKHKMILLSDAAFLGRKKQVFQSGLINGRLVDGFYRNEEGNLAGAAISMVEAVMNAEQHVHIPRQLALQMASTFVAEALQMEKLLGKIEAGYPAAFLCFNKDWSGYKTMVF